MDQHYCLRWNKHLTNLTDVLISLLEREALCDVTLSVGNNKTIKVNHRRLIPNESLIDFFSLNSHFDLHLSDEEREKSLNLLSCQLLVFHDFANFSLNRKLVPRPIKAHQAILSACSPYFENIFIENTHPHPIMYMGNVDFEDLKAIIEYIYKGEVNIAQHSLQKFLKTAVDLQVSITSLPNCELFHLKALHLFN
jgi:hypothetical protein